MYFCHQMQFYESENRMKGFRLCCLFGLIPIAALAQEPTNGKNPETIVDRINQAEPGKGSVLIIQDDNITERLGRPGKMAAAEEAPEFVVLSGYRIRVFAGNNQRISKNEAYAKEAEVKSLFPELSTYVVFTAPFWRLRVGDFQTFQEAQRMMVKLRTTLPAFGREMSIVKEKVRVKVK